MEIKKKYWEHLNSMKMQGVKVTTKLWKRSPFYAKIFTRLLTRDLGSLLSMSGSPHHFLQIYWIFLKLNKLNLTQLSFSKSPFFKFVELILKMALECRLIQRQIGVGYASSQTFFRAENINLSTLDTAKWSAFKTFQCNVCFYYNLQKHFLLVNFFGSDSAKFSSLNQVYILYI